MRTPAVRRSRPTPVVASLVATLVAALVLGACTDRAPLAPESAAARLAAADRPVAAAGSAELQRALAELRRASAKYHDVEAAKADGYTLLGCEGEGVGVIYVNGPLIDATIDPSAPEALVYTQSPSGRLRLAGVELVVPTAASPVPNAPTFFGHAFQLEDELDVWGLHVWLWVDNPDGMFEELNPRVSCES